MWWVGNQVQVMLLLSALSLYEWVCSHLCVAVSCLPMDVFHQVVSAATSTPNHILCTDNVGDISVVTFVGVPVFLCPSGFGLPYLLCQVCVFVSSATICQLDSLALELVERLSVQFTAR